jgi:hypothetical protein
LGILRKVARVPYHVAGAIEDTVSPSRRRIKRRLKTYAGLPAKPKRRRRRGR